RRTLDNGLRLLEEATAGMGEGAHLPGETAFKLYDTYGFPYDLTEDALRMRGIGVDRAGFDAAMAQQKAAARAAWKGSGQAAEGELWFDIAEREGSTEFTGYASTEGEGQVVALVAGGKEVDRAEAGAEVTVLGSRVNEKYAGKNMQVTVQADATTTDARAADFDAVVIPGGMAPDKMRTNMKTVRFVQDAVGQGKLVAAVCHGPQVLIEGDLLRGKRATGFRAIRKDMQNAGAQFENAPVVTDGNLLTSRRPGDIALFTSAILKRLGLSVKDKSLADETDERGGAAWQLAEAWGGSTKDEIVDGINTAIRGERYAHKAFEHYADKATDPAVKTLFAEIVASKARHISLLEARLAALGGEEDLQAAGSGAWATLKSWIQSSDDLSLLRRALGDLQTGVVDAFNLTNQFTDPATAAIFDEIEIDLAQHEQLVADHYHARLAAGDSKPATPTTGAAVSA
ncbi:MAG TPA: DJ-1/PfpI family protein, partial [Pyrinomonadaceae bacterium]|nr:DJ-1/PfpI family protein [Pyrinomonadaceae bacterium]